MENSKTRAEKEVPRWRKLVQQLRHASLTSLSRAIRKRWAEVHLMQRRIPVIENPAYRKNPDAPAFKLVKTPEEADASEALIRPVSESPAADDDEVKKALKKLALRPNSVVMIRGVNYMVPED